MAANLLLKAFHAPRLIIKKFRAAYRANLQRAAEFRVAGICTHCEKADALANSEYCEDCRLWVNSAP